MVTKEEVEARVEEGSSTLFHAGISLHRALMSIETQHFEDSLDALRECRDRLNTAIETYERVIEQAREGLLDEEIRDRDDELERQFFDAIERKGKLEGLFFEDDELWEYLETAALRNDPLAGYEQLVAQMTQLRNHVTGLVEDIENDESVEHVQHATWRTFTTYVRTTNLGQMIAFVNTETGKRRGTL